VRKLIYSMSVSLDGFIADRNGAIDWGAPDAEQHRFHNDQARATRVQLYGRGLYEEMRVWETLDQQPGASPEVVEFAEIWRAQPKVVFSTTLERVEGNARLVRENTVEEVRRLKAEESADIAVGGAGLAASLIPHGLVDEYRQFVRPVILGGGTPFFPPLDERINLELVETRTFGSRVVYARYRAR
jgi:dihydrofolate reductase